MKLSPRAWQEAMLRKFTRKVGTDREAGKTFTAFTADVVPGGGKTNAAHICAEALREQGMCDFVVIVSPRVSISKGWADKGRRDHGFHLHYGPMIPNWRDTPDGLSITIQALTSGLEYWAGFIQQRRALRVGLIVDEIHHFCSVLCPDGGEAARRWAEALSALSQAIQPAWQLNLSGTIFRSRPNERIVGVEYTEAGDGSSDLVAVADYTYGMAEAIRDRVVRPVRFAITDGHVTWRDTTGAITTNFKAELDKKGCSRRLQTALRKHGPGSLMRRMLELGHEELVKCRAGSTPGAAGQVIAADIGHARELAKVLKEITGRDPVLINSETEGSAGDLIDQFRESDEQWLISVDMVSEGVDIPRLRVQVYATNKLAEMYVRQAIARVQRQQDPERDETAVVIVPNDERIVGIAKHYEEAVRLALRPPEGSDPPGPDEPPGEPPPEPPPLDPWTPVSSTAEGLETLFRGEYIDPDVVAHFAREAEELGKDPVEVARVMTRRMSREDLERIKQNGEREAATSPEVDRTKQRTHLRNELQKSVRHLAYIRSGGDQDAFQQHVKEIHVEIGTTKLGGVAVMSIDQLERALAQAQRLILSAKQQQQQRRQEVF